MKNYIVKNADGTWEIFFLGESEYKGTQDGVLMFANYLHFKGTNIALAALEIRDEFTTANFDRNGIFLSVE